MGFFDRVGEIWGEWRDVRAGVAFEVAKVVTDDDDARKVARWFGNETPTGERFGDVLNAIDVPVSYGVKRPLATLRDVTGDEDPGLVPDFFRPHRWREAWNDSADVSVGQQIGASFGIGGAPMASDADELSPEDRERYFSESLTGRIFTGTIDALLYIPDPLVFAGKAPRAWAIARDSVKPDDVSQVFARSDEVTSGDLIRRTRRQERQRAMIDSFIESTEGRTISELSQTGMFKQSADGGTLAYWFGKADEIATKEDRFEAKRQILAAAFGDRDAIQRIRRFSDGLADDVDYMTREIEELQFAQLFTAPGGLDFSDALTRRNDPQRLKFLENQRDKLEEAMHQARRLAGTDATAAGVAGSLSRIRTDLNYGKVAAVVHDGHASHPFVHVITGHRIPGTFRTSDERSTDIFRDVLGRAQFLSVGRRQALMDRYVTAMPKERALIAAQAENEIYAALGKTYNIQPGQLAAMMRTIRGRKSAYLNQVLSRSRVYGNDSYVPLVDEDGVAMAIDKRMIEGLEGAEDVPMMASQLTDQVFMTDPRQLEKFLRRHASSPAGLAGFFRQVEKAGEKIWEPTEHFLTAANFLWKFSALFRIAYPMRIQVDTQLRMMAALRAQYLVFAAKGTTNYLRSLHLLDKDLRWMPNEQRRALTARIGEEAKTILGKYGEYDATVYRSREEMLRIFDELDPQHSMITLLTDVQFADLKSLRATGNWDRVAPGRPEWMTSYLRVVNQQFRNDPIAMKMIGGEDDETVIRWLTSDPDGRKHWRRLREWYGEREVLVGRVRSNVDQLVPPDSALRNTLVDRQLRMEDVKSFWRTPSERPPVWGELSVESGHAVQSFMTKTRDLAEKWYREVSSMPELTMGRHPLYVARFSAYFEDSVRRAEDVNGKLSLAQLEDIRNQARRLAQRDVANTLFDLSRQSNVAHMMRFISPFFAAWEDTMHKWGRLIGMNPGLIPRGYQAWGAPNAAGLVVDEDGNEIRKNGEVVDKDGNVVGHKNPLDPGQYVILPIKLKKAGVGSLRVSKTSFNIVFQGDPWWLPGPGPIAAVPVNTLLTGALPEIIPGAEQLNSFGPTLSEEKWAKWFMPYGPEESAGDVIRPAWIGRLWSLIQGDDAPDYRKTYVQLYQEAQNQIRLGLLPQMGDEELYDHVNRQVRNWFILRLLSAQASPVSVMPQSPLNFYLQEYRRYGREFGLEADRKFREDYPNYYEMAIRLTKSNTGLNATVEAWEGVQEFRPMLAKNPEYGWALAGAANLGGEFSPGAYTAQSVQDIGFGSNVKFREPLSPTEVARQNAVSQGWLNYQRGMTDLRLALEDRGLRTFEQSGAEDLNAIRKEFIAQLKDENPAWAKEYLEGGGNKVEQFLRWATGTAMKDRRLAERGDFRTLAEYMQGREQVIAVLQSRKYTSLEHPSNADVKAIWDEYVADLARQDIGFEQMYDRVLQNDDLSSMRPIVEE